MKTTRCSALCGAAFMAVAIMAATTALGAPDSTLDSNPEFTRLDTNHDGYVSRDEVKKIKDIEQAFGDADDNHDGKLDPDEFVKAQSIRDRIVAGRFIEDSVITAKIKAALLKDPSVSALDVKVETYKGTVLLSGFVADLKQAQRAAEIASGVRGVTEVRNSLIVKI